ncbi:MAG: LysR family transcriptional regulator [Panacagrimonas sp.]|jgi:DNA-binding transcriptional LysR family regulator|nr:LysR family transcriptional regulator [Panacagrimonas sp.]MCC2656612.1 LysR family transcriptional regulator [Panacagrimonas sp.]
MNLNHLSIFQAVAASGSVSAGAQRLQISQSAVSKQLGDFEHALGVTLFERLPRGVRLTEAGRLLQGYANNLVALEADAESAIRDLKLGVRGRLRIGASRTVGAYLMPALLARFRRRHPDVEIFLQVDSTGAIEQRLIASDLDIGFTEGIVGSELLDYRVFDRDELVLIAAPGHPITRTNPAPLSAVVQQPLLMHEVGSGTRAVTEKAFSSRRIALRPSMTLASTEAIKHTVATGVGIAVLSISAVRTELAAGTLKVVRMKGLTIDRPLYRIQRKGVWSSPSLQALVELLGEAG